MSHTTHHDDCGGQYAALNALLVKQRADFAKEVDALEARIATLEAELAEAQRDATFGAPLIVESYKAELLQRDVTINALRDALEDVLNNATCACYEDGEPGHCPRCAVAYQEARTALAQTPAASLAALKAEVLEPYKAALRVFIDNGDLDTYEESFAAEVRALAAQAATHSILEVKP